MAAEPQFNLSTDTYVKPDILVHPRAIKTPHLRGADALLVVEIADTSFRYDIKTKLPLHALHGVPEYWVIHAATFMTTVHRQPSGDAYAFTQEISPDERLVPSLLPELAISIAVLAMSAP